MKKIHFFILLFFFGSLISISQSKLNVKTDFVEMDYDKKRRNINSPVMFKDYIYIISNLRGKKDQYILTKYDLSMNKIKSQPLTKEGGISFYNRIINFNGKLFLVIGKKTGRRNYKIFTKEFNPGSLIVSKKETLLVENISDKTRKTFSNYHIRNNKLLVVREKYDNKNYGTAEVELIVFNEELKKQWSKLFEFDPKIKRIDFDDFKIDMNGNIFFVGKSKNKKTNNESYFLKGIIDNGKKELEQKVKFNKKEKLMNFKLELSQDELLLAGFLNGKYGQENVKKYFLYKIEKSNLEITSRLIEEIPLAISLKNERDKYAKKIKKKFSDKKTILDDHLVFTDIIVKNNKEIILIIESQHSYTNSYKNPNGNGGYTTEYCFRYGDIYVVNVSSSNKVNWVQKVPKSYFIKEKSLYKKVNLSFLLMKKKDNLFFIFNDHLDNHSIENRETKELKLNATHINKRILSIYKIEKDGKIKKEILAKRAKLDQLSMDTQKSIQLINGQGLIFFGSSYWQENSVMVVEP